MCNKLSRQQLITIWLGHKLKRLTPGDGVVTSINNDEYGDDEGHENTSIPQLSLRTLDELRQEIMQASSPDTIMDLKGNKHVWARQMQSIIDGAK